MAPMRRWLPIVLALAALSGLACRDHSGDATPLPVDAGPPRLALTALDPALIQSNCEYLVRCGFYADRALCESVLVFNLAEALGPHVDDGSVVYDEVVAATCIAGIRAGSCYFYDPAPPSPTICRQVFRGTVADEAPCMIDSQCRSGLCDSSEVCGPSQCCRGTCLALPVPRAVSEGDACTSEAEELTCGDGLVCKFTPEGVHRFTCVRRVGVGEACDDVPCQRELFCMPSTTGPATCVHYPRRGEPCSDALGVCAFRNDYCDKSTYTCVALAVAGAPCESDTTCARSNYCDLDGTHACTPRKGPGDTCNATRECLGFLDCIEGVCTKLPKRPVCP
jgi:hypothetical protein